MRAVSLLFFTAAGIIYKCDGTKDKCTNCTKKPANDVFVTSPTSETDAENKQKIAVQLNGKIHTLFMWPKAWLCNEAPTQTARVPTDDTIIGSADGYLSERSVNQRSSSCSLCIGEDMFFWWVMLLIDLLTLIT